MVVGGLWFMNGMVVYEGSMKDQWSMKDLKLRKTGQRHCVLLKLCIIKVRRALFQREDWSTWDWVRMRTCTIIIVKLHGWLECSWNVLCWNTLLECTLLIARSWCGQMKKIANPRIKRTWLCFRRIASHCNRWAVTAHTLIPPAAHPSCSRHKYRA